MAGIYNAVIVMNYNIKASANVTMVIKCNIKALINVWESWISCCVETDIWPNSG